MNWLSTLLGKFKLRDHILSNAWKVLCPVPSELVVSPAAYHAANGNLNVFLVVLFCYYRGLVAANNQLCCSLLLGRPIIYRFCK